MCLIVRASRYVVKSVLSFAAVTLSLVAVGFEGLLRPTGYGSAALDAKGTPN
jgi:hypothetical protein